MKNLSNMFRLGLSAHCAWQIRDLVWVEPCIEFCRYFEVVVDANVKRTIKDRIRDMSND